MKSDITIVGGGIIGLYSAYLLARWGTKPIILDRGNFGLESSWAAGGILTPLLPWEYNDNVLHLTQHANKAYQMLANTLFENSQHDIEYWPCGMNILSSDMEFSQIYNWCDKHAFEYQHGTHHTGPFYLPQVSQVRPPRVIKALLAELNRLEVTMLPDTTVLSCQISQNKITGIETSSGMIKTGNVIWAAGSWLPRFTPHQAIIRTPEITPVKGQIIALRSNPGILDRILYQDGYYLIPRKDGLILVGSTLEYSGYDASITNDAKKTLLQHGTEIMPQLAKARIEKQWAGLRPGSPGNVPTIGPHPEIKGLYFNCGHFRYGVAMAPTSAQILVSWICGNGTSLTQQERTYAHLWPSDVIS